MIKFKNMHVSYNSPIRSERQLNIKLVNHWANIVSLLIFVSAKITYIQLPKSLNRQCLNYSSINIFFFSQDICHKK